jgi:hypothetical protein
VKKVYALLSALLFVAYASIGAFGQVPADHSFSKSVSSQPRVRVVGYLAGREPDFLSMLPPYPVFNFMQDEADIATLRQWQQPDDSLRWKLANADVKMSYDRFAQAFATDINPVDTPLLVHLLDRVEQDVQGVAFLAKNFYHRPRPYQRFPMEHVCGADKAPAPEIPLKGGSSYPSGHTSFGWAAGIDSGGSRVGAGSGIAHPWPRIWRKPDRLRGPLSERHRGRPAHRNRGCRKIARRPGVQ